MVINRIPQQLTDDTKHIAKAREILAQMTVEEKLSMMHQRVPALERLGLKYFQTGAEVLHGVSWLGEATGLPQPPGLAATWDVDLLERLGEMVATELRAKHMENPTVGLNVWAPVINPQRHPRWGRNEEGLSEDPNLTAQLGTAYARGLRGTDPQQWRTVPTAKHFLAYSNEIDRSSTNSQLRPRVLHEYELAAHHGAIASGSFGAIMPSYNLVNGRPAHLCGDLVSQLRATSPHELLFVSDAGAPTNVLNPERYWDTPGESAAALVRAGVDSFTDHDADTSPTMEKLRAALAEGLLTEDDINQAAFRLLLTRARTGEFDPESDPYADVAATEINLPAHQELAREAAAKSLVVLRNDDELLPLDPAAKVAVVGPFATDVLRDWYSGDFPYKSDLAAALQDRSEAEVLVATGTDRVALRSTRTGAYLRVTADEFLTADALEQGPDTEFDLQDWGYEVFSLRAVTTGKFVTGGGYAVRVSNERIGGWWAMEGWRLQYHGDGTVTLVHNITNRWLRTMHHNNVAITEPVLEHQAEHFELVVVRDGLAEAQAAAAAADVVLVTGGNDPHIGGRETEDRPTVALPEWVQRLWATASGANNKAALLLLSSYPYALGAAGEAKTIVWAAHAGQEQGRGLVDVLYGDVEPYGRLTQTWPADTSVDDGLLDYDIIKAGQTYWYNRAPVAFPFGHGLSYTTVSYADLQVPADASGLELDETIPVSLTITNTGNRSVAEVVQIYVSAPDHRLAFPTQKIADYRRVQLAPGEAAAVNFEVPVRLLATWDVRSEQMLVEGGTYVISAGRSAEDLPLQANIQVSGHELGARDLVGTVLAVNFDDVENLEIVDYSRERGDALATALPTLEGSFEFHDVTLDSLAGAEVEVARWAAGAARVAVEVSINDAWVELASANIPAAATRYDWHTVGLALNPQAEEAGAITGTLRIRLSGPGRIAAVNF